MNKVDFQSVKKVFRRFGRATTYLLVTDYLSMVVTFGMALHLRRYRPSMDIVNLTTWTVVPEVMFVVFFSFAILGLFSNLGLYKRRTFFSTSYHIVSLIQAVASTMLGYIALKALTKALFLVPSRYVMLLWGGFLLGTLLIHRILIFPLLFRVATRSGLQRRVLLIGSNPLTLEIIQQWRERRMTTPFEPVGILSDKADAESIKGVPLLGTIRDLHHLVPLHNIEGAVLVAPDLPIHELMELIEDCVRLFGWVDIHAPQAAVLHEKLDADVIFNLPFARLAAVPASRLYLGYKRLIDLILASLGLLILSPLLLLIVALIKLTSPGPLLYAKERIGQNGQPFLFYKFRSMRVGADQDPERLKKILSHMRQGDVVAQKVVNSAMVTPVGRLLRKTGLDEIPQLFNVLRGNLSLIGPRPLPKEEYEAQTDWQKWRFKIKPGCTGLWKIMIAKESGATFSDSVLYDIYYARHMNPMLDLFILAKTAWIIVSGRADG